MGNIKELKQQNLLEVIGILRKEKELSKQALAKFMGLSTVSAHSFINELSEKNIVMDSGISDNNCGRKATLFRLNPHFGFTVGICLSSSKIDTVTYNFASELISSFTLNIEKVPDEELCGSILLQARLAISNHEEEYGKCLGIGIAMPAIVDHTTSLIKKIIRFPGFKHFDLKFLIQDALQIPVFIGNDNKMCMNAIKWIENRFTNLPMAFIGVEEGVGSGILIDGKILEGANSVVSEIGHISIDLNGPLCNCGGRGCIETYISERVLINKVIEHLNHTMNDSTGYSTETFTIQHVISLAKHNPFIDTVLKECCDYFCVLLENVVKIYDPKEIIIECEYLKQLPEYFEYLCDKFYHSPWVIGQDYNISLNKIQNVYATGGAMTVLGNIYSNNSENILLDLLE